MASLVVVIGPIAAGKSTVAEALADRLVADGRSVAVVDVDDVVFMQRAPLEQFDRTWERGRAVHGELVGRWLRSDVDVVVAHGPAYTAEETTALMADVPDDVPVLRALLLVPYDVALDRVTADPDRALSRDPDFLRRTHDRFTALLPTIPPCDRTYRTEEVDAATIASDLAALVP